MVDIIIAHAQADKDLGAGKEGGVRVMALCQKKDCTNESPSPLKRKCHLCRKCHKGFMDDKNQTDLPLKGGKTMTKGPIKQGRFGPYPTLQIEAFHLQPLVVLQEFTRDFSTHQSTDVLSMDVGPPRTEIR